jgi:exodeoxyribonuclease VII small subunit
MAKDDTKAEIPADIAKLSFEDALAQLEEIVRNLEGGDSALDDAIAAYERGAALKQHCESKLRQAQARVEKISLGADGTPEAEPVASD